MAPKVGSSRAKRPLGRPRGGSDKLVKTLLAAALKQLGERGFTALSVSELARTVGVNKTSIYRRWPSKAELILAAVRALRDSKRTAPPSGDLRRDLVRVLRVKAALVQSKPGRKLVRALIALDEDRDLVSISSALRKERYASTIALLEPAIDRGELAPDTDPKLLSELLLAPLYHRLIFLNQPIGRRFLEEVVDKLLDGARPRKKQL